MASDLSFMASRPATDDGDIFTTFNCPICLGMLDEPRVLPGCGHSFCTSCLNHVYTSKNAESAIPLRRLACPECRKFSKIGKAGILGYGVNFSVKTAILALKEQQKKFSTTLVCPHVPFLTETARLCQHCGSNFCHHCQVIHIEVLRLEINLMADSFAERFSKVREGLNERVAVCQRHVKGMVEKAEKEQDQTTISSRVRSKKVNKPPSDLLIEQARQIATEEMKKLDLITASSAHLMDKQSELESRVSALNAASPLCITLDSVAQLHGEVFTIDSELWNFEHFDKEVLSSYIAYKSNPSPVPNSTKSRKMAFYVLEKQYGEPANYKKVPSEVKTLYAAAKDGDFSKLQAMLSREDLSEACRRLLANYRMGDAPTLLMVAASEGYVEMVKYLTVKLGADVRATLQDSGDMAIHLAIRYRRPDVVDFFLDHNADLADVKNGKNKTPLLLVMGSHRCPANEPKIVDRSMSILKTLVSKNVDLYTADNNGNTALHLSALYGVVEKVRFLLQHAASLLEIKNKDGWTPLFSAIDGPSFPANKASVAKCLVEEFKADVNARNSNDMTPLLHAVGAGNLDAVRFLVDHGANLDVVDADKGTVLHKAATLGNVDVIDFLLSRKPDLLNASCNKGKTPLQIAKSLKNNEIVKFLKKYAATLGGK